MPEHRHRLHGYRILVIEDEYFLADDLEKVLRDEGAKVIGPTGDRDEALRLVAIDGFDLAIVDINLHDELAYPLADELERQSIPYVFATGYSRDIIPDKYARILRWEKPYELRGLVNGLVELCKRTKRMPPIKSGV